MCDRTYCLLRDSRLRVHMLSWVGRLGNTFKYVAPCFNIASLFLKTAFVLIASFSTFTGRSGHETCSVTVVLCLTSVTRDHLAKELY